MKYMRNNITLILLSLLFTTFFAGCFLFPSTNHAPTITSTEVTTAAVGVAYTYDVEATDPDGDTLTYSLTTKPTGMTITSTTGLINWTPTSTGDYDVMVEVSDNGSPAESITQSFTIRVEEEPEPTNHAPTITSTPITSATVCQAYSYNVDATDLDGDTLTYSLTTKPTGMTINSSTGLISWTPTATGDYDVTVRVSDGKKTVTQSFTVSVHIGICGEVLQTHDLAEQKLNDIVEDPDIDIENALTILGEYLNEQTGVGSTVIDDNLLQINYESGIISFILLQEITTEPTLGSMEIKSTPPILLSQQTTEANVVREKPIKNNYNLQITKDIDDVAYTGSRNVLIWVPFAAEFKTWGYNVVSEFITRFEDSTLDFTILPFEDRAADVASLKNITNNYGMVIFNTHGENGNWLATGEEYYGITNYNLKKGNIAIWQNMEIQVDGNGVDVLGKTPVYVVNSNWFELNLAGNFSNTIILNMSCESAKTDALWNVFKDKGAEAYFGFDDKTTEHFATDQGYDLVEKLREGELSTGESYQMAIDPYYVYASLWLLKGNYNLKFPRDTISFITVIPSTMSLVEGDSQTIASITAHYSDGSGSTADIALDDCTYDSSNTGIATVNTGVITAVTEGTATITVSYTESGITKTDTVAVTVNAITPTPEMILSPVVGDLEIVSSIEQCSNTKWCFNQHKSGNHCQGGGICQADDTYAWDVNLNTPSHDSDNGMPVYAVEEGIISQTYGGCINAGGSYGQLLIEHTYQSNSWWSGYLHLKDIQVTTGQSVDQNTLLGYISNTSPETIPNHLHFVVYKGQNSPSGLISFDANIIPRDFPQTYYTITASAGPHGSISPSGGVIVNEGSDKLFTITPDTGYYIADVLVDGSSIGAVNSHTFTNVTEDHTISATFSAAATGPVHNLTKDTYYNTIQEALDDADSLGGDTIEVDDGTYNESITFPANKVVTLQSASGIRDNVIIQGANNFATVTTNVSSTGTTLRGFTITHTGGNTGRGIYIGNGNLIVDNCIISSNTADDSGGGICNYSGTLTITSSTISGNAADEGGGGGIYNCEGTIDITESTISGNTAYAGSGIFNGGTLTITSSTISGNAADEGGGIYNQDGILTITSSAISGNTATSRHGGGIGNNRGTLTITSSTISGNTATYSGGGIDNNDGIINITSSTIYSNTTTTDQGGGIHNNGTLTITSSAISDNTATRGGGINNYGTLTITSSTISGNTAVNNMGGGIYSSVTLTITESTIFGNTAADDGGGICNRGTLTITESTISSNTSDKYGGGIYSSVTLTITGSNISGNNVSQQGGGIYLGGTGTITIGGDVADDKNTICGNYKSGYDPSLDQQIRGDSGDLYETYKDTNYISAHCGVPSGSVHNLTKDTYYDTIQAALNDADSLGGDTIEVSDGTYDESITFPSGKKIVLQSINGTSSTTIRGDNGSPTATFDGSLEGTTLEGFTITHVSGNEGEGIYNRGDLNIKNCVISGNSTHDSLGGGIYNGGSMTISGSTISDNFASRSYFYEWGGGGGISNSGTLTITESTISGNSANVGGGMYNYGTLIITSSIISGNSGGSGGGISNSGTLTITESTISDNSADNSGGGGIFNFSDNDNSTLTISGCTISGNSSQFGGGISNHEHATLTITESTISGNFATNNSGGICIAGIGNLTISGCTISGNSSNVGGGMYLFSSITIAIGGDIASDKNTICGNYKTGEDPSLDQQIRDNSGSLYETYKDTNYISAYCE